MKKFLLLFLGLLLISPASLEASHFRYGYLSWAPTGNPGEVEFHLINGYRRSAYTGSGPDGLPVTGDVVEEDFTGTRFEFGDGFRTPVLEYVITSYSVTEDYMVGEAVNPGTTNRYILHTYSGIGPYQANISSCCRISELNNRGDADYLVETLVYPLSGNRSPVSSMFPVITLPEAADVSFFVPAADLDGDRLRWRLSTNEEAGEAGEDPPPNLTINSTNGLVTWNNIGLEKTGYWSVQVMVEDLNGNGNVKTKTPVDFMLRISNNPDNHPPLCIINPPGQINTYLGVPTSFILSGSDPDAGDIVTLNTGGLPFGARMTPSLPVTGTPDQTVQSTFNWTPSGAQGGVYSLIFSAYDSEGFQTLASAIINVSPFLVSGGIPPVLAEDCIATNGAVDPGEIVTLNFPIKNLGALATTNVVATLLTNGSVMPSGGSQVYGAIPASGIASRPFTFRANGPCAGTFIATIQLQEGANNLGSIDFPMTLGLNTQAFSENFDGVSAPNLPLGWTNLLQGAVTNWATSSSVAHTLPNSAFAPAPAVSSLNDLISPTIFVPFPNGLLSFRHSFETQTNHDFCSIQISVNGGPFTNILAIGGSFVTNGYIGQGWSGDSGGLVTTMLILPPSAASQNIKLRWRLSTDSNTGGPGWYIDTVNITGGQSCCFKPDTMDLELTVIDSPDPTMPGAPLTYTVKVKNNGPTNASNVVVSNTLPPGASFVSATNTQGNFTRNGDLVTCNFGAISNGATATLTITITPATAGLITNAATVTVTEYDYNYQNNIATNVTAVALGIVAANVSVVEGNSGTTNMTFTVFLSAVSQSIVSVDFSIFPNSASIGTDYFDSSGQITFFPGETNQTLSVTINGDTLNEYDETIFLTLFNAVNAAIVTPQPVGTIINDDFRPNLALSIAGITAESFPPANGVIDPGETVTVTLVVNNVSEGAATTTNLTVQLLASGGVTGPSGTQTYGVISPGGVLPKPFTFKASGSCGSTVISSFRVRDGTANYGNTLFPFLLGQRVVTFSQNFDANGGSMPGWTPSVVGGDFAWSPSGVLSDTPLFSIYAPDPSSRSTNELTSPPIAIATTSAQLSFRHFYGFETNQDGGALQISIGGGGFTSILSAGGAFVTNGYNGSTLLNGACWTGSTVDFITTVVDLPPSAFGQTIQLRWRLTSDNFNASLGWYVDTISLFDGFICATLPPSLSAVRATGNTLSIYWPTNAASYSVQYATNLMAPVNWLPVTNALLVVGTNYCVSNNLVGKERFYRLHSP